MSEFDERDDVPQLPGMGEEKPAFNPAELPGAEVMFEDEDGTKVVRVPLSAFDDSTEDGFDPADFPPEFAASLPPEIRRLLGLPDTGKPGEGHADLLSLLGPVGVPMGLRGGEAALYELSMIQFEWATEELENAKERHPETDPKVFEDSFVITKPLPEHTTLLQHEPVFRAHARELFDRLADGTDMSTATDGEVLGLLIDAFDSQPFCDGLQSLYLSLAEKIVPEAYRDLLARDGNQTPETVAQYHKENAEDAEFHRKQIVELLSHERQVDDRPEGEDDEELKELLAVLRAGLGLDPEA